MRDGLVSFHHLVLKEIGLACISAPTSHRPTPPSRSRVRGIVLLQHNLHPLNELARHICPRNNLQQYAFALLGFLFFPIATKQMDSPPHPHRIASLELAHDFLRKSSLHHLRFTEQFHRTQPTTRSLALPLAPTLAYASITASASSGLLPSSFFCSGLGSTIRLMHWGEKR